MRVNKFQSDWPLKGGAVIIKQIWNLSGIQMFVRMKKKMIC